MEPDMMVPDMMVPDQGQIIEFDAMISTDMYLEMDQDTTSEVDQLVQLSPDAMPYGGAETGNEEVDADRSTALPDIGLEGSYDPAVFQKPRTSSGCQSAPDFTAPFANWWVLLLIMLSSKALSKRRYS